MSDIFINSQRITIELELGELRALGIALNAVRVCSDPDCDNPLHLVFGYALNCGRHAVARALREAGVPEEYVEDLKDSQARTRAALDQRKARLRELGLL